MSSSFALSAAVKYGCYVSADGTEYKPRGLQAVYIGVDTTGKNTVSVS